MAQVKFIATGRRSCVLPFTVKNSDGTTVVNRSITFNQGAKLRGKIIPAHYQTSDEQEIAYLRKFESEIGYIKEVKPVIQKDPSKSKVKVITPTPPPVDEEEDLDEEDEVKDIEIKDVSGISTIPAAINYLRENFTGVKPAQLRTKEKIAEKALELGINFTDL